MLYLERVYRGRTRLRDEGSGDLFQPVWDFATRFWGTRVFFVTENGHLGFGNIGTQAGDNVCVLLGEAVLYIRKPPETKTLHGRRDSYRDPRSVAYVHGLMMGKALEDFKEEEHEIFNII